MRKLSTLALVFFVFNATAQCWDKIACGAYEGLSINYTGQLYYWGGGNPTITPKIPTLINSDTDWVAVYGGTQYRIAKKSNGTLWAWGFNGSGQLGLGTTSATGDTIIPEQIGTSTDWNTVSAGGAQTIALKNDGTLWSWGSNQYGQLGDGTSSNYNASPTQVGIENNWHAISAGSSHTLAIKNDGTLWAWGRNNYGQLGDGTLVNKSVPTQIGTDTNWKSISASYTNSLALKSDGTLWAWGYNNAGQVGNGTNNFTPVTSPSQVGTDTDWQKISSGRYSSYGLKQNGTIYHFGTNTAGQNGNGSIAIQNFDTPIQIGVENDWTIICAGSDFVLAKKTNGNLYSWGYNYAGQLGIGNTIDQYSPVLVTTCNLATDLFAITAVKIFPNPTKNNLNITTTASLQKTIIYNLLGTKVYEQPYNETIDVSTLAKGMYVVKFYTDNNAVFVEKFVKE